MHEPENKQRSLHDDIRQITRQVVGMYTNTLSKH